MCLAWRPRRSRFPNLLYRGFLTRNRFAASKASELATVLPIGNRRYSRFGNLRYIQRALNRYAAAAAHGGAAAPTPPNQGISKEGTTRNWFALRPWTVLT